MDFTGLKKVQHLSLNCDPTIIVTIDNRKISVPNITGDTSSGYCPDWEKISKLSRYTDRSYENDTCEPPKKKCRAHAFSF